MCFLIWQKIYHLIFLWKLFKWGFQTLHYYNLSWGLPIPHMVWWPWPCFKVTGVSESKLQIVVFLWVFFSSDFYPLWFKHCIFLTFSKKVRYHMLCVTGVFLAAITKMIFSTLPSNVSYFSVCSSSTVSDQAAGKICIWLYAYSLTTCQIARCLAFG